jgi:hypothetical protein
MLVRSAIRHLPAGRSPGPGLAIGAPREMIQPGAVDPKRARRFE